jgi:hypothetical protein
MKPNYLLMSLILIMATRTPGNAQELGAIRSKVLQNESLTNLIKMNYSVELNWGEFRLSESSRIRKSGGSRYSGYNGTWAQDGIRQFSDMTPFYENGKPGKSYIRVINGEVAKWARKPDLMVGAIQNIKDYDYLGLAPATLGMRLFGNAHSLGELLDSKHAEVIRPVTIQNNTETYLIKISNKNTGGHCLVWLDKEKAVPLQLQYYGENYKNEEDWSAKIEVTEVYQLPNKGWVPVKGRKLLRLGGGVQGIETIEVDKESITIKREEIPDSLFDIQFPEGADVANLIVGHPGKENEKSAEAEKSRAKTKTNAK